MSTKPAAEGHTALSPFLNLPVELQLHITSHLPYPDALALKHTNSHFYLLVSTSIRLKVAWLISRHERHLTCPSRNCFLKTDGAFCLGTNGEVKAIMERRRRHGECKAGDGGCEVIVGATCRGPKMGLAGTLKEGLTGCIGWLSARVEGWALWALVALIFSIAFNVWLILRSGTVLYGLLTAGEGSLAFSRYAV